MPYATVLNKDDGMTVKELAECLAKLVEEGKGDLPVYERRGDDVMRYVDVSDSRVCIMEAY